MSESLTSCFLSAVPLTDLYIYEAGEPVNLEQIALIVSALADEADKLSREVLEIPHLAEFVEGLGRISPHCDEITKEAIAVMQDMWRARVLRLVINPPQPVPTWGDWLVTQPAPAINTAVNNGWLEVDQVGDHLLPFPVGPLHAPIATPSAMATPSGLPPALDVSLPELDETKRPYAAWMAYADKQLMVLAAARYIEQFPYLGMTLEKEPTLEKQARREAFQLIYEGGQINIEVGELFLSAFKKQKMFEEQTGGQKIVDSLGGPNAYAQSLIQNANDSDFEYYLSEGEDDTESDESGL